MNDNDPSFDSDLPLQIENLLDKHDLWSRSDSPIGVAVVLLADAAFDLNRVSELIYAEHAITPASRQHLRRVMAMVRDADSCAPFCLTTASPAVITESDDGVLRRWPLKEERSEKARRKARQLCASLVAEQNLDGLPVVDVMQEVFGLLASMLDAEDPDEPEGVRVRRLRRFVDAE